jgi:hypothetical protein
MKSTAVRRIQPQARDYLGPAEVTEVGPAEVIAELDDGTTVRVTPAFTAPYEPVAGDELLVIGRGDAHWAIGVIRGSGRTSLRLQGDVDLHAEGGTLRLGADEGVEIRGPEIALHADKLQVLAGAVVEKITSLYQRVTGLLHVRARNVHTDVEETSVTQAKSAAIVTEQTVTINGREVHLG